MSARTARPAIHEYMSCLPFLGGCWWNYGMGGRCAHALICIGVLALAPQAQAMVFEPNVGQAPPAARYVARLPGATAFFTRRGAAFAVAGARKPVWLRVEDGRARAPRAAGPRLPGVVNAYLGRDR